jgi:hypothetical protein
VFEIKNLVNVVLVHGNVAFSLRGAMTAGGIAIAICLFPHDRREPCHSRGRADRGNLSLWHTRCKRFLGASGTL